MLALLIVGVVSTVEAQETFRRKDGVLNVAIGVPEVGGYKFPPLSATYEQCIADGIGKNGSLGLGAQAEVVGYTGGISMFVGPRVAFHYEFTENLDSYIGVQAGLAFAKSALGFGWAGVLGARYYLSNDFALFGELGTGFSVLKLGATFRL